MPKKSQLPAVWEDLPSAFRRRVGDQAGRQRLMAADGHLLLVLHQPPGPDDATRLGRFFWRKPDGTWLSNLPGSGIASLLAHLEQYAELLDGYERQEDAAATAREYFDILTGLAPLHRAIHNMHKVLQEARQAAADDRELINARDRAYDLERTADILYAAAKNGLDFAMARRAEEQAQSSRRMSLAAHRLNLLAAYFVPVATLSAIFGVNLQTGLEAAAPPWPFVAVVAAGILSGAALHGSILRGRGDNEQPL
jgi:hypothetical protein